MTNGCQVFRLKGDAKWPWLYHDDRRTSDLLDRFTRERVAEHWSPVPRLVRCLQGVSRRLRDAPLADCPHSFQGGVLYFSRRAVDALRPELDEAHAEVLPIDCGEGEFYAINVLRPTGDLDYQSSEKVLFPSTGRLMTIKRFVFRPAVVEGPPIFVTSELDGWVFVTRRFMERVEGIGLTGFKFVPIWPLEVGGKSS